MLSLKFQIAYSPDLLEQIYRLRYQVYIKENKFLPEEPYQEEKESDRFDKDSIHIAAIDRNGQLAGAVRLVLDSGCGFPMEEYSHYPIFNQNTGINRKHTAEISRLVIRKDYRINQWGNPYRVVIAEKSANLTRECRCTISPILFGLYGIAFQESQRRNINFWCAAMEDSLYRLVYAHGFIFRQLGEPINYYGSVVPRLAELSAIEKSVRALKSVKEEILYDFSEAALV